LARGDAAGADSAFRAAAERSGSQELSGTRIRAYVGLGRAALAAGSEEEAARYLLTVCRLYRDPDTLPPVLLETIRLLDGLGRADEAAELRSVLLSDYPGSEEAATVSAAAAAPAASR
ncbi:MAG: hypothetical protein IJ678_06620, partial [Kiritimatiellae bacterium]|nr:hypothetical protein [Kiritimatiellia bacterium]